MHYASRDFTSNGLPTIVSKTANVVLLTNGQKPDSQIMTASDITAVKGFYKCTLKPPVVNKPFSFKLNNNLVISNLGININVYALQGVALSFKYSILYGKTGPITSTTTNVAWYAISSDKKYIAVWDSGASPFTTSGATINTPNLMWYYF